MLSTSDTFSFGPEWLPITQPPTDIIPLTEYRSRYNAYQLPLTRYFWDSATNQLYSNAHGGTLYTMTPFTHNGTAHYKMHDINGNGFRATRSILALRYPMAN
jgi:hypothetical protein